MAEVSKRPAKKTVAKRVMKKAAPKVRNEEELGLDDLVDTSTPDNAKVSEPEVLTAEYTFQNATPGTWRFREDYEPGELPITSTIYLKNTAVTRLAEATRIRVTIEAID